MIQPFLPHIRNLISPLKKILSDAYRLSKSLHSPVTSIFTSEKTWISPYIHQTPRCIGPANKNLYWRVQTKIPEKKGKNSPSLLKKGTSIKKTVWKQPTVFLGCFCCSRNKSLVQILSLEISWDQVPFSKLEKWFQVEEILLPWFALSETNIVPENRPHPKRNCSSWLW